MNALLPYQTTELKTKHMQFRTTEQFYNHLRSFAKKHQLSMTEVIEIAVSALVASDSELDK